VEEDCRRCPMTGFYPPIWSTRTRIVLGQGDPSSKVFFIGEAPNREEDAEGAPFVGKVGKVFDELLGSIGLNREAVYITNLVKCRPANGRGGDREPVCYEVIACLPYTLREINKVKPRVLCPMGSLALGCFLPRYTRLSDVHGKPHRYGDKVLIPLYHPASALSKPELLETMKADMLAVKRALEETG
ncbi:MAG: uracil-DNA glycosylase, partial [Nitrososphaerota archaeon]